MLSLPWFFPVCCKDPIKPWQNIIKEVDHKTRCIFIRFPNDMTCLVRWQKAEASVFSLEDLDIGSANGIDGVQFSEMQWKPCLWWSWSRFMFFIASSSLDGHLCLCILSAESFETTGHASQFVHMPLRALSLPRVQHWKEKPLEDLPPCFCSHDLTVERKQICIMPGTAETCLVTKLEEGTLMLVLSCCTYRWVQWRWRWLWWWCHLSAARRFARLENEPHNVLRFKLPVPQHKDLEIKLNAEHRKSLHNHLH
jgi:hypothetical protein